MEKDSLSTASPNPPLQNTQKTLVRLLALSTLLFFLATAFRAGWQRLETDFPNYYTAAVLVQKHQPLRNYYDWTWFARQMIYAGMERQTGSYTPQTPLTMLPMVGLTWLPVQDAKRVWLIQNLAFLAAILWMLSRVTKFRIEVIWLLAFCGYFSLFTNFLLGQYYVFLLFLLALTFYLLHSGWSRSSGFIAGVAFALKLYGGPLLLYFVAKRRWKAVAGMLAAMLGAGFLTIAIFPDVRYYLTQVLLRTLEGGSVDPYHPGNPGLSTLLRHWFVSEPELNPHPLWNAPWLFFFSRTFLSLGILAFATLGVMKSRKSDRRDFAWFLIAVLLLSTSIASYSFILLLLPVTLLLHDSSRREACYLVASYVLLTLPLRPDWLFPKLWLLLALFIVLGWDYWRGLSLQWIAGVAALVFVVAFLDARSHLRHYEEEPGRHFAPILAGGRSLFSSFPVFAKSGLFFQSMGTDRYVIRWLHDGQAEDISLDGDAFHPFALPDGRIAIELASHRTSQTVAFNPSTREVVLIAAPALANDSDSALSPDGKWLAFTTEEAVGMHLWLRSVPDGRELRLASGNCNSSWPAWRPDSHSLVFASDCGRAYGLPSLYSVSVPDQLWPN